MSWKSLVTAGLLCALASPAFAAPTVQVIKGGTQASSYLDASGNFVWKVRLLQSSPIVDIDNGGPITPGSPLAAEFGFQTTNSPILGATVNAADFDDPNPGNVVFPWQDLTALGGTGACDSATPGNCPVGLQWSGAGDTPTNGSAPNNQAFAAFGSVDYGTDADGKDFITFTTDGPRSDLATYSLATLGTYGDGGNKGRIAELNDAYDGDGTPPISLNYDTYAQTYTLSVIAGDANLDGTVNDGDLNLVLSNFNDAATTWQLGNFNNQTDNVTNDGDLNIVLSNFNDSGPIGPGAGGGGAVPEPATIAMLALAAFGFAGFRRR